MNNYIVCKKTSVRYTFNVLAFLLSVIFVCSPLRAGEIAITFDDAPRPDTALFSGVERTQRLIESLQSANVSEAMFFVTASNINQANKTRLSLYSEAGYQLASHSFAHLSANQINAEDFIQDFDQAHQVLSNYPSYQYYFRYPFLHKGDTLNKQKTILKHIQDSGYEVGYVTIDNYDWYMDSLLQQAIQQGKTVDYEKLGDLYVETLWQAVQFYDELAVETLGRSPKHVLLLHENDLAALYIDDLVNILQTRGWKIISPQLAFEDAIATLPANTFLGSQGRIATLTKAKGVPEDKLRHKTENQNYLNALFEKASVFKSN